jgi:hypothetical protein
MSDLDVVFVSYDEPNADRHFEALRCCAPRPPKRVHGIKGFHRAYAKAAAMAETPRFLTVDADSIVRGELLFATTIDDRGMDDLVFSFGARNTVNGLIYGNGGVKCWPARLLFRVGTHEEAKSESARTDFCFVYRYCGLDEIGSDNDFASTPFHAFRAGYREAVKLSLDSGQKTESWEAARILIDFANWSRLLVWLSVGADVLNGLWAVYGARMGLIDFWVRHSVRPEEIADYDWFRRLWRLRGEASVAELPKLLAELNEGLNTLGVDAPLLDAATSRWFKQVYLNQPRRGMYNPAKPSPFDP